ncbi:MAG: hypothetical protein JSW58_16750 [Candidatus Latescibacterota bacterium]|nr:MAG: hypothetical protein JSW58_16750 [Candidatus Latescibacterota bacterium]
MIQKTKTFFVLAVLVIGTYLVCEIAVTLLYVGGVLERPTTMWLFEDSGRTVHFDAIRGYRLSTVPSRITRITKGTTEYVGALKGNNQGFPDRDDFYPKRGDGQEKRLAVFVDSYTAAQFLDKNWPDHAEDLSKGGPGNVQLLNFSVDGGGLGNWWSVLTRLIEQDGYEIDGVIFAIIPGDLWRRFSVSDHQNQDHPMFARMPSWDPKTFPANLEEARPYLRPMTSNGHIVSKDEFDRALEGAWRPRANRPVRPYFAWKLWQALRVRVPAGQELATPPKAFDSFDPGQEWIIKDIARVLKAMNIPAMVVHVPSREDLFQDNRDAAPPLDTRLFAILLGARLVDGKEAYAGHSGDEIRAMWHRYDAHWGQAGSNQFGQYMAGVLADWP